MINYSDSGNHHKSPFVIAATHRCGSYLFCDLLSRYGDLPPVEEFLNENLLAARRLLRLSVDCGNVEVLQRLIQHYESQYGRFALKAMWPAFISYFWNLKKLRGSKDGNLWAIICEVLPCARFLFVRRRDKIRQAVSFARAQQSGVWRQDADGGPVPEVSSKLHYSYRAILSCLRQIERDEAGWLDFLGKHGILYHEVWYEDLLEQRQQTLEQALAFIGERPVLSKVPEPGVQKTSDVLNAVWVDRFQARMQTAALSCDCGALVPESGQMAEIRCQHRLPLTVSPGDSPLLSFTIINRSTSPWRPVMDAAGFSSLTVTLRDPESGEDINGTMVVEEDITEPVDPCESITVTLQIRHEGRGGVRELTVALEQHHQPFAGALPVLIDYEVDMASQVLEGIFGHVSPTHWQNWVHVPVLGALYTVSFPWIYQFEHGWVKLLPELCTPGVVVLEDSKIGRLEICLSDYPKMIRLKGQSEQLIRFEGIGADKLRTFVDLDGSSRSWTVPVNEPETLV